MLRCVLLFIALFRQTSSARVPCLVVSTCSTLLPLGVFRFSPCPLGVVGFFRAQQRGQRDASVAQGRPPLYLGFAGSFADILLLGAEVFLVPLARSVLCLFFLALLRLVCNALVPRGRRNRLLSFSPLAGSSALPCLSLGRAACVEPVLPWTPVVSSKRPVAGRHVNTRRCRSPGCLLRTLCHLGSLLSMPGFSSVCQVWAPLGGFYALATPAFAMARAEGPEDLPLAPPPPPETGACGT